MLFMWTRAFTVDTTLAVSLLSVVSHLLDAQLQSTEARLWLVFYCSCRFMTVHLQLLSISVSVVDSRQKRMLMLMCVCLRIARDKQSPIE